MTSLENATKIEFLTTMARVLQEEGLLPYRYTQDLRQRIQFFQRNFQIDEEKRLWPLLLKENHEFVQILETVFGSSNIGLYFLADQFKSQTVHFLFEFCEFVKVLNDRSKIVFNRFVPAYFDNQFVCQTLYSTLLKDFNTYVFDCAEHFDELLSQQDKIYVHGLFLDPKTLRAFDRFAKEAGFAKGVVSDAYPYMPFFKQKQEFFGKIQLFTKLVEEWTLVMGAQAKKDHQHPFKDKKESFRNLCFEITNICSLLTMSSPPHFQSLLDWELYREDSEKKINHLFGLVKELKKEVLEQFILLENTNQEEFFIGLYESKQIGRQLIKEGVSVKETQKILEDVSSYCKFHRTSFNKLIPGELDSISNILHQKVHGMLPTLQSEGFSKKEDIKDEKQANLQWIESSQEKVTSILERLSFLMIIGCFFLINCGVKTTPKSVLLDYEPGIPFREDTVEEEEHNHERPVSKIP